MGSIKNYLINHPEIMERQRFDESYRLRISEERELYDSDEDLAIINTQLANDSFNNQNQNHAIAQSNP